jgi:hypothetical protein
MSPETIVVVALPFSCLESAQLSAVSLQPFVTLELSHPCDQRMDERINGSAPSRPETAHPFIRSPIR